MWCSKGLFLRGARCTECTTKDIAENRGMLNGRDDELEESGSDMVNVDKNESMCFLDADR